MTQPTYPARPTVYKGIQMRSRLEAKFAARLDTLNESWRYEPMCFADEHGEYMPDFSIAGLDGRTIYVEVKPTEQLALDWLGDKMPVIWKSDPDAHLVATWRVENEYERPRWRCITAHPQTPLRTWLSLLPDTSIINDTGSRLILQWEHETITLDVLDDLTFNDLHNAFYDDCRANGFLNERQLWWAGPALPEADGWRLVTSEHTSYPWYPPFFEISNIGEITDTYRGQAFAMSPTAMQIHTIEWSQAT